MKSWVVWMKDGRYAYAWGDTAEEARASWLRMWEEGIARVAPAGEQVNQPPPHRKIEPISKGGKQMPADWIEIL